jgi:glutathione synthase/RimK-type ligase-like ATP-grasp enzyme
VEINEADAVAVSANKLLMKRAFDDAGIKTAVWGTHNGEAFVNGSNEAVEIGYPMVAKHIYGSRGTGNHLLKDKAAVDSFLSGKKDLTKYIFEKYYDYNREYRLHVSKDGCFYTCRKMLKGDVPKEKRWFRNDSNSVWIKDDNALFDKPTNWDAIVADCVRALEAVGLDFAAFDVRVQSAKKKNKEGADVVNESPEWIIIESNSAPSFGEVTAQRYADVLPKLIADKANTI